MLGVEVSSDPLRRNHPCVQPRVVARGETARPSTWANLTASLPHAFKSPVPSTSASWPSTPPRPVPPRCSPISTAGSSSRSRSSSTPSTASEGRRRAASAITTHGLQDLVIAIEQTGAYHRPMKPPTPPPASRRGSFIPPSPAISARPAPTTTRPTPPIWRGSFALRSMASGSSSPPGIRPTPPCNSWPAIAATWSPKRRGSAARSWSTSRPACPATQSVLTMSLLLRLH